MHDTMTQLSPDEQARYDIADKALTYLNVYIQKNIPLERFGGSFYGFCDVAKRLYPKGLMGLDKLEQKLDSPLLTPEEYKVQARIWLEGWRNLIAKVIAATEQRRG